MGVESTADEMIKMLPNGHKAELKSQREKKLLVSTSITTGNLAIPWKIENSEDLYRIEGWGRPYFSINAAGHVTVSPKGERGGSLDLFELVNALQQRNLGLPMLIRFSDILEDRIERLNACFAKAIARYNYPGVYRGVFP
ncbi:MAG: arginine decarboxylase, partial [Dolichospermum sp.]